ncbi:MAG: hypothetical protein ABSA46_06295 [Thermodesulfovibrionales bacterium]
MNIKNLAEHIMLQCIEDLWDERERDDCRHFFKGERFRLCAEMASMSLHDQSTLLNMVSKIMDRTTTAKRKPKSIGEKTTCFTVRPKKTREAKSLLPMKVSTSITLRRKPVLLHSGKARPLSGRDQTSHIARRTPQL